MFSFLINQKDVTRYDVFAKGICIGTCVKTQRKKPWWGIVEGLEKQICGNTRKQVAESMLRKYEKMKEEVM